MQTVQISRRLKAVAAMVTPGVRLADVGTDHGYIPIYLIQTEKIRCAVAMDINQGPLERAQEHIRQYGLGEQIETRLSDGLYALAPGEADSIVIAGMGGLLMVRILEEGKAVLETGPELILQPQSEIRQVRAYLETEGYEIVQEDLVLEEGKYYPMMRAVKRGAKAAGEETDPLLRELGLRFGPKLLAEHHPLLDAYLKREEMLSLRVLESLDGKHTEAAVRRRLEIGQELELLRSARSLCRKKQG